MKDIFQHDIEVGDHVVYIISAARRHLERAIVTESEEKFIKIEYVGVSSNDSSWRKKEKGKKSRLTTTEAKIIILDSRQSDDKNIYKDERKRFDEDIKKIKKKLAKVLEAGERLVIKNEKLQAEVDKINNRFDILDL